MGKSFGKYFWTILYNLMERKRLGTQRASDKQCWDLRDEV